MMERPDIIAVIEQHVSLRRSGKEFTGRCPFHGDKSPSFSVNYDKQVFYCHGCGEGGDSISFIQKLHGIGFKEALKFLGVEGEYKPDRKTIRRRHEAKKISEWAHGVSLILGEKLRGIGERQRVCRMLRKLSNSDRSFLGREEASLRRQWTILSDFDDDFQNPEAAIEAWGNRAEIDNFVGGLS